MILIFLDEQENPQKPLKFTAIHGVVVEADKLLGLREKFYSDLTAILRLPKEIDGVRQGRILPVLHGSNLLPEYDDPVKLAAVDLIFSSFVEAGAVFFRLGYYNDAVQNVMNTKEERVHFCTFQLLIALRGSSIGPFALIHEMDQRGLQRFFRFTSDDLSLYHSLGTGGISINYPNYVGHYIGSKRDLGCQMADLAGYVALRAEPSESDFAMGLAAIYSKYAKNYFIDKIIQIEHR